MMNCLEFRRQVGAEPAAAGPEFDAHRRECAACARHQDELRAMDALIARALAVETARIRAPAIRRPAAPAQRRRIFAIAASLVAGLSVGLVLLTGAPRTSIAREVFGHIAHEQGTMERTVPIAPGELAGVLDPGGTRLRPALGDVTFAKRCLYNGHVVPHLVVRLPEGAVTVLLLRHLEIEAPVQLAEQELAGVVLPAPRGSIAIVGESLADPEGVARKVFEAVDWGV